MYNTLSRNGTFRRTTLFDAQEAARIPLVWPESPEAAQVTRGTPSPRRRPQSPEAALALGGGLSPGRRLEILESFQKVTRI